jgi:hypothetical protein
VAQRQVFDRIAVDRSREPACALPTMTSVLIISAACQGPNATRDAS